MTAEKTIDPDQIEPYQDTGTLNRRRATAAFMAGWNALLWIIALFVTRGGAAGILDGDLLPADVATVLAGTIMLIAFGTVLWLRRRALRAAGRAKAQDTTGRGHVREGMIDREKVNSSLFAAWATLDIAGFVCGIIVLMMATRLMLLVTLPLLVAGIVLTFPRSEWYGRG